MRLQHLIKSLDFITVFVIVLVGILHHSTSSRDLSLFSSALSLCRRIQYLFIGSLRITWKSPMRTQADKNNRFTLRWSITGEFSREHINPTTNNWITNGITYSHCVAILHNPFPFSICEFSHRRARCVGTSGHRSTFPFRSPFLPRPRARFAKRTSGKLASVNREIARSH